MVSTDPKGKPEPESGFLYVDLAVPADREYRLAGTTTRLGKWWIRLFPEADRAASP